MSVMSWALHTALSCCFCTECCVVEALTLWNNYFWFMGLLCSGGNPLAELLSCHWRTDSFHASQLCYSFTHHSCPLSEAILSWQNFQFHKWGSQELLFVILGVPEREWVSVLEDDVAKEQCWKKQHLLLCIFSDLQSKYLLIFFCFNICA